MKPLEEMNWLDVCNMLRHGTVILANGWTMHQWPESHWLENFVLRMGEETKTFKSASDMMNYVVFHGATFYPIVVDAEDAKQERIERHLERARQR